MSQQSESMSQVGHEVLIQSIPVIPSPIPSPLPSPLPAPGPSPTPQAAYVDSFDPPAASVDQTVTIRGGGFTVGSRVFFNGIEAGNVDHTGVPGTLRATVPAKAKSGQIQVDLSFSGGSFRVLPTFASNMPSSGTPLNTTVVITGTGYNDKPIVVKFAGPNGPGTVPAVVTGGDERTIGVTVPDGIVRGPLLVQTSGGMVMGGDFSPLVQPPNIKNKDGFTPTSGPVGTEVRLMAKVGTQFQGITEVTFKGPGIPKRVPAVFSVIERKTVIVTKVPAGAVTGTIRVSNPTGADTTSSDFVVTPS
jgi:hypothetical protein